MKKAVAILAIPAAIGILVAGCGSTASNANNATSTMSDEELSKPLDDAMQQAQDSAPVPESEQDDAVEAAQQYLESQSFSRSGLIAQLKYEGYTLAEATFAVDQVGADWMEQAALTAQSYLDSQPFSRSSLIEQLEYDGFTPAQAVYGVSQTGL